MKEFLESIEDFKEYLNQELRSLESGNTEIENVTRETLISVYYDFCMIQEKILPGSSGLEIEKSPTEVEL